LIWLVAQAATRSGDWSPRSIPASTVFGLWERALHLRDKLLHKCSIRKKLSSCNRARTYEESHARLGSANCWFGGTRLRPKKAAECHSARKRVYCADLLRHQRGWIAGVCPASRNQRDSFCGLASSEIRRSGQRPRGSAGPRPRSASAIRRRFAIVGGERRRRCRGIRARVPARASGAKWPLPPK
jgi:hypothetical protein